MAEIIVTDSAGMLKGAEPLYLHIRRTIKEHIERGEYPAGAAIPSENELATSFGTTRLTVRAAISDLVARGLIRRMQGKGAFVVPHWIETYAPLAGFREEARASDGTPSVRQLAKTKRLAGPYFAHLFQIDEDDVLYSVRRLNSIDDEPVSLELALMPLKLFKDIENVDVSVFSLYETYEAFGHKVACTQEKLDIVALSAREAGLLQIEPGNLALSLECLSYDQQGLVIEYAYALNRGDRGGYYYRY